jgi:hypothetical protein
MFHRLRRAISGNYARMATWYRVTFKHPNGWTYETSGRADSEAEAVRLADGTLEYVERVGIKDYLKADGVSVEPPARLSVTSIGEDEAGSGFGLVITDPQGRTIRK